VCDFDSDVVLAEIGNSANISRQLPNTLEPSGTVTERQTYLWSDGVGETEPIARDCICVSVVEVSFAPYSLDW